MMLYASMMSYDWSVVDDVTSKYSCNLPSTKLKAARSNTRDLLPIKCAGKSIPLRKELSVEEKDKIEKKSLQAAGF
jgi:hypothetical protein